ncbi:putative DNA modification/repair radical SAM protein [Utexia brackfieldae]|uniref:putative DNA modification/repair radical SAM protein n=1 Tax=Utexia brackfieldae TaxID=3074108 RepID=UPI00370DA766
MRKEIIDKLVILAESAKYDISCASSGTTRNNTSQGIGNANGWGICHSYTEDGRCVALLKIMLTNFCLYDCAYCINRRSNDIPRAAFSPKELANLTIEFYRRNYIEGLFLSSGIIKNPDHTMERMINVVKLLRTEHQYNGYIHMKTIPGASKELTYQAGLYADRLSINLEIPTEQNLKLLAPEKDHQSIYKPMHHIQQYTLESKEDRKKHRNAPRFAPAGQSTQIIIGATNETDKDILNLTSVLYQRPTMKRVYYSGFIPVNEYDKRLPVVKDVPKLRENRLYQADWLLRFYQFNVNEIVNDLHPELELDIDPKLSWALRHPEYFPVDVNRASYEQILRVPGIGIKSARMIVSARQHGALTLNALKRIGVVLKRAQYFIHCRDKSMLTIHEAKPENVRLALIAPTPIPRGQPEQLSIGF